MIKFLLLLVFFSVILAGAYAVEIPLSEFDFEEISLNGLEQKECTNLTIDLNYAKYSQVSPDGILSIKASFKSNEGDNTYVSVSIDGGEPQFIWPENFACKESCWARVFVNEVKNNKFDLELCLATGGKTSSATLFADSKIGLYNSPVLVVKNSSFESIFLGERAKMQTLVQNTGSKEADFFVQFVAPDIRSFLDIKSFDIVEGDASASANISPGQNLSFSYYIKPIQKSSYNLPSSVLIFTNIFGEKQTILTNHVYLDVKAPEEVVVSVIGQDIGEGKLPFKVVVKNSRNEEFEGVLEIVPQDIVTSNIESIKISPKSQKEFTFETKNLPPGKYIVSAKVISDNIIYSSSEIAFEIPQENGLFKIVLAVIGIILGAAIFLAIYFFGSKF